MRIICADNEKFALDILVRAVQEAAPEAEVRSCLKVPDVFRLVQSEGFLPEVAFLDIEMPGMSGLELATELKKTMPEINIVFVTGYSEYAVEAMMLRPSGYVMKPVTKEKILDELENLRHPLQSKEKEIRIQCFGNFEVFVNDKPVFFTRAKAKELLAYLVDCRGAGAERIEMASILWENIAYDRSHQLQLNVIRAELIKSLEAAGIGNILIRSRNSLAVAPDQFDCDYYQAMGGNTSALNRFHGEYMRQYSWAEFTAEILNQQEK